MCHHIDHIDYIYKCISWICFTQDVNASREAGVLGVRRVDKKDIKRIAKVTGAQVRCCDAGKATFSQNFSCDASSLR